MVGYLQHEVLSVKSPALVVQKACTCGGRTSLLHLLLNVRTWSSVKAQGNRPLPILTTAVPVSFISWMTARNLVISSGLFPPVLAPTKTASSRRLTTVIYSPTSKPRSKLATSASRNCSVSELISTNRPDEQASFLHFEIIDSLGRKS